MKKLIAILLLAALMTAAAAGAETAINGAEDRGIVLQEVGLNETPEGYSPTTGRLLSEIEIPSESFGGLAVNGRYQPMMVQIDNADNGSGYRAPWGAQYVDVVYETPLYKKGDTRISFIFSDVVPDDVGPIRSARMGHAWIREEWDAGFMFSGLQTYPKTNVEDELKKLGVYDKGLAFSGSDNKYGKSHPWAKFYYRRKGFKSPHNKGANAAAILELIPETQVAPNHAYLFTDEPAQGDAAARVTVDWGNKDYYSEYHFDAEKNAYIRYTYLPNKKGKRTEAPYVELETQEALTFNNVIIQYCEVEWSRSDAPVTHNAGDSTWFGKKTFVAQGNADFFMNGVHVKGYWKRENMASRTVFYGPDGKEMPMQRGRTMIIMLPPEHTATYE